MTEYYSKAEKQLVRQCLQNDRQAQRALYDRYIQAMYHTVIRMVPDQMTAEDVLQEAFTLIFRKLASFQGTSSLGAWIKQIVVNTALSSIRKQKRMSFLSVEDHLLNLAEEPEDYTEVPIAQIHEAIKHLPEGCRTIFNLYQMEGYQHQEIADILGITESTSKTQYRRARKLLQVSLKKKLRDSEAIS